MIEIKLDSFVRNGRFISKKAILKELTHPEFIEMSDSKDVNGLEKIVFTSVNYAIGFEEMMATPGHESEQEFRRRMCDTLYGIVSDKAQYRLIITSTQAPRETGWDWVDDLGELLCLRLGPLNYDDLREFCVNTESLYIHCNQLALLQLLEFSGGHPIFVKVILEGLLDFIRRRMTKQMRYVSCDHVSDVINHIVQQDLDAQYDSFPITTIWNSYLPDEQAALAALSKTLRSLGEDTVDSDRVEIYYRARRMEKVTSILDRLVTRHVLTNQYGRYKFAIPLLEQWMSNKLDRES